MKFACLSLAVLLLASLVKTENVWEADENSYKEVMKNLDEEREQEHEKKEVATEEESEDKRDALKLSLGEKGEGKGKDKAEFKVKLKIGTKDKKIKKGDEAGTMKVTKIGPKKTIKWTSSFVSSWTVGAPKVKYYTSVFSVAKVFKRKMKKPRIIIRTGVSYGLEREAAWIYEFSLATCECNEFYIAANEWFETQLLLWQKAVQQLYLRVFKMSLKLKKLGAGWLLRVDDDKYKVWIEWVSYLEQMRLKFISMGRVAFLKAYEDQVKGRFELLTTRLTGAILSRLVEASNFLYGKAEAAAKAKFAMYFGYRSKRIRIYHIINANIWRRSETSKFNAMLARFYRKGLAWYEVRGKSFQWWWKAFLKIVNDLYRKFIGFLQMWYKQFKVRGHGWYMKYLRVQWMSFIKVITQRVVSLSENLFATASVKVLTSGMKTKVTSSMTGMMKSFSRFETRLQPKIQKIFSEGKKQIVKHVIKRRVGWWLELEPDWSYQFNIEVCECGSRLLAANSWMTAQLIRWDTRVRELKHRVRTWYKKHQVCGSGWLKQAKDAIYEVWIQYVKFLDDLRENFISSETSASLTTVNAQVEAKFKQLYGQLNQRVLLLIMRGRQLLEGQDSSVIHYDYKHKLRYRLISANIWRRKCSTKFRSYLAGYVRMANTWYSKHGGELTWWWTIYNRFVQNVYSQYVNLMKIYFDGIRQYGYRWYLKYSGGKWRKFIKIVKKKVKHAHRVIFARSHNKLRGGASETVKSDFIAQMKVINHGFEQLNTRLQRKLLIFVNEGYSMEVVQKRRPLLHVFSKANWPLAAPQRWIKKFNYFKGWKSGRQDLAANRWMNRELKKWGKKVKKVKKVISKWYKKHKKIGKWWKAQAFDDVHELWGDWANYLHKTRSQLVKTRTLDDRLSLASDAKFKLKELVSKLERRIEDRISEGQQAYEWQLISKQPITKTYKPRFLHQHRTMKATIWRLHETAKYQAFFKNAHNSVLKWISKYKFNRKQWFPTYWKIVSSTYENFESVIDLWYKEMIGKGKGWYMKYLRKTWPKVINVVKTKTQGFLDLLVHITSVRIKPSTKFVSKELIDSVKKRLLKLKYRSKRFTERMIAKSKRIFRKGLLIASKPAKIKKFSLILKESSGFSLENCNCGETQLAANNWMDIQMKKWRKYSHSIVASIHAWYKRNHQIGRWWLVKAMNAVNKVWIEYVTYLEGLRKRYLASSSSSNVLVIDGLAQGKLNILLDELKEAVQVRFKQCARRLQEGVITEKQIKAATCEVNKSKLKQKVRELSAKIWKRKHLTEYKAFLKKYVIEVKNFIRPHASKLKWWWNMYKKAVNKMNNCLTSIAKVNSKAIKRHGHKFFSKNVRRKYRSHLETVLHQLANVNKSLVTHLTSKHHSKLAVRKHLKQVLSFVSKSCVNVQRKLTFHITARHRQEVKANQMKTAKKVKPVGRIILRRSQRQKQTVDKPKRRTGFWLGSQGLKRKKRLQVTSGSSKRKHKVTDIVVIAPRRIHGKIRATSKGYLRVQRKEDDEPCEEEKPGSSQKVVPRKITGFWLGSQGLKRKPKGRIIPRARQSLKFKTGKVGGKVQVKSKIGTLKFKQGSKLVEKEEPCDDDKLTLPKQTAAKKRTGFWLGSQGLKRKAKGRIIPRARLSMKLKTGKVGAKIQLKTSSGTGKIKRISFKLKHKKKVGGKFDLRLPRLPKLKIFQTREFKPRFDLFENDLCSNKPELLKKAAAAKKRTGFWLGSQGLKRKQKKVAKKQAGKIRVKLAGKKISKAKKLKFLIDLFGEDICSRKRSPRKVRKCLRRVKKLLAKKKKTGFWLGAERLKRKQKAAKAKAAKSKQSSKSIKPKRTGFWLGAERLKRKEKKKAKKSLAKKKAKKSLAKKKAKKSLVKKKAKLCRTDDLGFVTRCLRFRETMLQKEIRNICGAVAFSQHIGLLKKVLCTERPNLLLNVEKPTKIIQTPQGKLACHYVDPTKATRPSFSDKPTATKPKADCYWLGPERLRRRRKPRRKPKGSLPKLPKIEFNRYREPLPLPKTISVRCSKKSRVVRIKSEKRTTCVPKEVKVTSCSRREYRQCRTYRPNRCCPTDFLGDILKNRKLTVNIVNLNGGSACHRVCGDSGVKKKFFTGKRRLVCVCQ